ncbi:MAG: putative metal-binding motif-containing protein, partial [Saprospiraceae bacterium]
MKKFTLLFCMSLFLLNFTTATNGNREDLASNGQPTPKQQSRAKIASASCDPSAILCNKETGEEKTMIVGCDLTTYQSATILGAGNFPYTSGTGITVSVSTNVGTLENQNYSCNGNTFSTAPIAWWINATDQYIILTFSAPVTNFSMVMNGSNNTEVFTFTPATGTVSLNNFCTAAFEVIGAGNQLRCNASGTNGTLVSINNTTGSTQYTITHNGLLAGSRISLLDCYVAAPLPVVDPESNVQACGTETVPQITFTGTAGATFNWTNNNTAIGLAASGSGNIASFTAANVTSQQVATITVTPVLSPQTGTPITFTITVKPKPTLTIGTTMSPVTCGGFNGSIAFTTTNLPNGIYSLTYTGPGSPQNVIVSGNAFLLSGRSAGSYSNFSITNNGCSGTVAGPVNLTDPSYTWYRDFDGDTFGNPAMTQTSCTQPVGYVANNTDCDDNDALEKPGQVWYDDTDNDGHGQTGAATITQCLRPTGYKAASELMSTNGDCNDNNFNIKPGATEVCDGVDNDCDGSTDEGVLTTWYRDFDSDTFGNPSLTQTACSQPVGYVANNTDCDDNDPLEKPGQIWYDDTDNDGHGQTGAASITACLRPTGYKAAVELMSTAGDCNDNNAAIKPGATELCDGVDNDCDGSTDEGVLTTYYRDMDGDTFGNPAMTQQACSQPVGYVTNNTDCDDNDPLEKPGQVWYDDTDNDGYGQTGASPLTQCLRPTGYRLVSELISTTGDCNDNASNVNPGASEVCDGQDNNCNTITDENVTNFYYRDMDGDGFGNPLNTQAGCIAPTGYVANDDDCNDNNAAIKPGATEVCDGVDNDCDGSTDEGVLTTYYRDMDGDAFGNPAMTQQACSQPVGYVTNNTDCDDNDPLEKPGQIWYKDADGDDYSDGTTLTQCLRPTNYYVENELIETIGDCNDAVAAINPAATEICDGIDNDCDGMLDNGTLTTYYQDSDEDGFGNSAATQQACSPPTGYVANDDDCNDNDELEFPGQVWYKDADGDDYSDGATLTQCLRPANYFVAGELTATTGDCNDAIAAINPAATEICDGIDNDCDGSTDEGLTFITYYTDADGDGYGTGAGQSLCANPGAGFATLNGDCNDNNDDINPAATEICDGIDNNCDGMIDNGALTTYYQDSDEDGFGNPAASQQACSPPIGYVTNNTDCDDNDELEFPGQVWYKDVDGDDYSDGTTLTQCLRPANYFVENELIETSGDCNDAVAAINPAAAEICDEIDNDCDGMTDEGVQTTYYEDTDMDGFGDPNSFTMACSLPIGYVANDDDCDDMDALEFPGQVWYKDADGDDYSDGMTLTQCLRPTNYFVVSELIATSGDCNDAVATIN